MCRRERLGCAPPPSKIAVLTIFIIICGTSAAQYRWTFIATFTASQTRLHHTLIAWKIRCRSINRSSMNYELRLCRGNNANLFGHFLNTRCCFYSETVGVLYIFCIFSKRCDSPFFVITSRNRNRRCYPTLEPGHLNVTRDPVTRPVPGGHVIRVSTRSLISYE